MNMSIQFTALDLPAGTVRKARAARQRPWTVEFERDMTEQDLLLVHSVSGPQPSKPNAPLAAIRDPHHMLARLLAEGKPIVEVSAVTGYSTTRIRTLQADPSFKELIAHYSEQKLFAEADITAQVKHIALTAGAVLQERLEAEPDSFSNEELRRLHEGSLDRIGHGPSANVNHSINNPAEILAALKDALVVENRGTIIHRKEIEASYEVINGQVSAEHSTAPLESGDDE